MLMIGTTPLWGQSLLSYWNFNTGANGTPWNAPIPASTGTGVITAGTWTWGDVIFTEGFAGSAQNALFGDPAGASLSLRNNLMNGNYIQFEFSMEGFENLIISYWTQKTSTGFNNNQWSWSSDGVNFTNFGALINPALTPGSVITLETSALNLSQTAYLRYTLNGATSATGNNRIDNVQIQATQVGAIAPPSNLIATAVSISQINLGWTLNNNNNSVLLAWSADGIFGNPSGTYQIGNTIAGGGTVLYYGTEATAVHQNLTANTKYHYKAWSHAGSAYSTGVTANATTFPEPNITTLPYTEAFDLDLGDCLWFSVSGHTKYWIHGIYEGNGYASMNGFNSGDLETDWLILPGVNLNNYTNEVLTFNTWWRYGVDDETNYLKLYYSTNYAGNGSPVNATWTELQFTRPTVEQTWTASGSIDLSQIQGQLVYIGFKYQYEVGKYKWWQVDNISMTGDSGTVLPGDANCDGIVNILDVISLVNYIVGMNPQPFCPENADLNADGQINILDIVITTNIIMQGN